MLVHINSLPKENAKFDPSFLITTASWFSWPSTGCNILDTRIKIYNWRHIFFSLWEDCFIWLTIYSLPYPKLQVKWILQQQLLSLRIMNPNRVLGPYFKITDRVFPRWFMKRLGHKSTGRKMRIRNFTVGTKKTRLIKCLLYLCGNQPRGKWNKLKSSGRFNSHKDCRIKIRKTKSSWLFEIVTCESQTVLQVYVPETTWKTCWRINRMFYRKLKFSGPYSRPYGRIRPANLADNSASTIWEM